LRKEKGDPSDMSFNSYFEKNPGMIIGDETTRNGKFGPEQYVALRDGETFDDALDRIKADAVQAMPIGDKTDAEKAKENVKVEAEPAPAKAGVARPSRVLSSLIPLSQLQVTRENPKAYSDSIETLNEKVKKIPKLYSGENLKEHPVALHYFTSGTDIYVTEWDGKDTFFGHTILNGDTQNAEWGYSSLSDIMGVPAMNLDYDTDLGTVEAAISKLGERESEAEAHRNRSQAMMGNENAKKEGLTDREKQLKPSSPETGKKARKPKTAIVETAPAGNIVTDSIDNFNKKYNLNIPFQSLPVWKATGWDGKIDMTALSEADKDFVIKSGNYVIDRDGNWMDKINFASGNIYRKLKRLENDKEALGEKIYKQQKELLQAALPPAKKIGSFVVSPISQFAKSFQVKNADGEPVGDLRDAFVKWA
jgi:hypothetical protein